jgi:hypothetical protein
LEEKQTSAGLAPAERKRKDQEAFCPDLEWFLVAGDAAMGARGTLGGVVAQLEHGGPFTGVPNLDLYSDAQVGWGKTTIGLVERHRWLALAWFSLAETTRNRLCLRYQAARSKYRGDQLTGARSGIEAQLGEFGALAIATVENPAQLLEACFQPQKGKHSRVIARAVKQAREASVADHSEWTTAKIAARAPRSRLERVVIGKKFEHGDQG